MKIKIDVWHLARLAQIKLTSKELKKFEIELPKIIKYFTLLKKVDTQKVEPLTSTPGQRNKTRKDKPAPSMNQKDVLKNAAQTHNNFFKIPPVF